MTATMPTTGALVRPDWLDSRAWPHTITTIDHGKHQLAVTDAGQGPTLLFVHVGMWSFVWRDVLAELTPRWRCITFDAPGNGLTTGPARVDLARASTAVDRVVRELDLSDLILVVHDLGGPVALDAATEWPERVRGIAAINTFAWRPHGAAFCSMLAMIGSTAVRELDVATGWLPRLTSTRFGVGRRWGRDLRRTFRRGMHAHGRRAFHHYLRSARHHDYARVDHAVECLADAPVVSVFGERNDPLGFQPQWADRFADIVQRQVPSGNHFPMCDDPHLVAQSIETRFGRPAPRSILERRVCSGLPAGRDSDIPEGGPAAAILRYSV